MIRVAAPEATQGESEAVEFKGCGYCGHFAGHTTDEHATQGEGTP